MPEELRGLGIHLDMIAEMLAVSSWTVHRRVAEYGLQNMTGFDDFKFLDESLDRIIQDYINSHGSASGCIIASYLGKLTLAS